MGDPIIGEGYDGELLIEEEHIGELILGEEYKMELMEEESSAEDVAKLRYFGWTILLLANFLSAWQGG